MINQSNTGNNRVCTHHSPANYTKKWGTAMEGHRTEGFHSICSSEDSQQCHEEIDDIQIQWHWSPNVVIIGVTLNQVVCVVHDVPTEYDCSQKPIDHNRDLTQGKEYLEVDKARIDKSNPNKKMEAKFAEEIGPKDWQRQIWIHIPEWQKRE